MGLTNSPLLRRCGAENETSAHLLCGCEALVTLAHVYLDSIFLDPEAIKSLNLGGGGGVWKFRKQTGLPWPGNTLRGIKGPFLRPSASIR
jgi:hypothetical protein